LYKFFFHNMLRLRSRADPASGAVRRVPLNIGLTPRWRGTPSSITEWRLEHHYATYNDFDGDDRFPTGIRWLSDREFAIEGGEGGGSVFEVER
jgi:hypothetical protein